MLFKTRVFRFAKRASLGLVVLISAPLAYELYENDLDFEHLAVARIGRAGVAVVEIAADYKRNIAANRHLASDSVEWRDIKSEIHLRSARRLLDLCRANGGAYIKVGQHVGSLEYLLPWEYVKTFKVLHSDAPRTPLPDLLQVVRQELGRDPDQLFRSFDPDPLGTASLAQVHKAELFDGRVVAVKIQHPRVKQRAAVDVRTMEFLLNCVAFLFPKFELLWLAEETKKNLPKELDFLHEGRNTEKMAKMLSDVSFLKIPRIHWDLSTDRVLTMEYCEGGQVDDLEYVKTHRIPVHEVTRKLGEVFSRMIFRHGFVHCDPHPGNVLVSRENDEVKIVLLDHGLYQTLTDDFRSDYAKLWLAIIAGDVARIEAQAARLEAREMTILLACIVAGRSWASIRSGVADTPKTKSEMEEMRGRAGNLVVDITRLLNRIPRQLLLLFKTNELLRGIEGSLSSPPSSSSFLTMSRFCLKAVEEEEGKRETGWKGWAWRTASTRWRLTKISLYEWILWLRGR